MMFADFIKTQLAQIGIDVRRNPYIEPQQLQRHLIKVPTPVVFDVGAHIGLTSQSYRQLFPNAVIHAFEPFPVSRAKLEAAIASDEHSHVHALALSDQNGTKTLFVNEAEATNSLKPVSKEAAQHWGEGRLNPSQQLSIETSTIDAFCAAQNIDQIDILKIDVQGAEYEVLQGAGTMLKRHAIKLLQFEVILAQTYDGQRPLHEYLSLMDSLQYQLLDIYQPIRRSGRLLQADLMFASPEIHVT